MCSATECLLRVLEIIKATATVRCVRILPVSTIVRVYGEYCVSEEYGSQINVKMVIEMCICMEVNLNIYATRMERLREKIL